MITMHFKSKENKHCPTQATTLMTWASSLLCPDSQSPLISSNIIQDPGNEDAEEQSNTGLQGRRVECLLAAREVGNQLSKNAFSDTQNLNIESLLDRGRHLLYVFHSQPPAASKASTYFFTLLVEYTNVTTKIPLVLLSMCLFMFHWSLH